MKAKLETSIERAIVLLGTARDYEHYLCLKIAPAGGGCCCFHCWPHTWQKVNRTIQPFGPLEDEGDALIDTGDGRFVLECHESGPEIVIYVGAATAGILLIKAVVELITTIIKSKSEDPRRRASKFTITKRTFVGSYYREDRIIEVDLPADEAVSEILTTQLHEALNKSTKLSKTLDRDVAKSRRVP